MLHPDEDSTRSSFYIHVKLINLSYLAVSQMPCLRLVAFCVLTLAVKEMDGAQEIMDIEELVKYGRSTQYDAQCF